MKKKHFSRVTLVALLLAAASLAYISFNKSDTGLQPTSESLSNVDATTGGALDDAETVAATEEVAHPSDCDHCLAEETSANAKSVLSTKPELDHIFKNLASHKDRVIPKATFDFFKGSKIGERASVEIAGQEYTGQISVVRENHKLARTYGMALDDQLGALLVTTDAGGYMRGHFMFLGDSRAISFKDVKLRTEGNHEPSLIYYEGKISDIFCAAPNAVYNGVGASLPGATESAENVTAGTSAGLNSVVVAALESIPDSEYVMYLDFDGEVVTNTPWNLMEINDQDEDVDPIIALPLARADEEEWVELVWERVVEDFAPFDINVTTDRAVFDAADLDKRLHVVITLTDTAAVGAGGVAILHSFREDSPVVWAFNSDEAVCADTISHEAGHAFGLSHDGLTTPVTEYYGGHNTDYEPGWAPIMGAYFADGTDDEVTQWSRGQYDFANNLEDDIAIIGDDVDPQLGVNEEEFAEQIGDNELGQPWYDILFPNGVGISNGFGFKADDVSDNIAAATDLTVTGEDEVGGSGFIGTSEDIDLFRFVAPTGDLAFTVSPLNVDSTYTESNSESSGANLAVDIALLDVDGNVIELGEDLGDNELSSTFRTFVNEGIYYLRVDGGGRGADAATGFSDYSSMGVYNIIGQLDLPPLIVYGGDKQTEVVFDGDTGVSTTNGTDYGFSTPNTSVSNTFLLENVGTAIDIDNIIVTLEEGTDFEIGTPLPSGAISPQGAKELIIIYNPTSTGVHQDTVTIAYEGGEAETYEFAVRGVATISATEDNYENNNTSLDAYDISNFEGILLSNIDGPAFFLSDAIDFYSFTTTPGDGYVVVDFGLFEVGNVQFELYSVRNNILSLLQTSTTFSGSLQYIIPEEIRDEATQFLIRVASSDNISVRNEYDLRWSATPLSVGGDDFYEDNDNQGEAFDLTGNEGSLSDFLLPAILSDEDWYKITVPEDPFTRMLYVSALFDHEQGNIDFQIIKDDEIIATSESEDDNELQTIHTEIDLSTVTTDFEPSNNILVMGVEAGTYFIRVYGDFAGNEYDLVVERLSDDKYEEGSDDPETENDTFEDAFDLGETIAGKWLSEVDGIGTVAGYEVGATAEEFENLSDPDWYQFSLPSDEVIEQLTLEYEYFDGGFGDAVDFVIVDASGNVVASTDDTSPPTGTLTLVRPSDTNYWILVEPTGSLQWLSGYDFKVDFTAEPPFIENPVEDNYEQNDNALQTFNITSNEGRWLSSLDGYGTQLDPDWYRISFPDDATRLEVTLFHFEADGDIDLRLTRNQGPLLFTSESGGNTESIVWDNPQSSPSHNGYTIGVVGENRGNFYNLFWDVTLFEDNYEENDSLATATDLTGHEGRFLNKLNGTGIQRDEDWYRISADADTVELRVELSFTHSEGDIDLALYNPNGSILQRSITTTSNEQIIYPEPNPGDYYVRVYFGDAGNEYDMVWFATSQAELDAIPVEDDLYELYAGFTDNNTAEQAYVLDETQNRLSRITVFDEELEQEVNLGIGIQKDDDWYQIEIPSGNVGLRIECLFTDADGDIDFEVFDPIGFPLAIRDSITDNELLDIRTPVPAGTYQIRVYGVDLGNEYDLYWNAFVEDVYEENDNSGEAADVNLELGGPLVNPTLGDDDWYVFTASGDDPFIRVDLSYLDEDGAIDFQILDSSFNVLATADNTEDSEFALIQVTAGTYYVYVYGDNLYNPYDMTISVIGDDEFEENDIADDAADISGSPDILAVQFDTDWFKFDLTEAGTFLSIITSFTHANGNIDLALFAADEFGNPILGSPLATSETELNNETIRVEGAPGTYFVRVTGDDINQRYRLIWTVNPDDEFEQNDQLIDAFEITGFEGSAIDAIQFDEDWFFIDVPPGNIRVNVDLDFVNEEGDLNLAIFNSDEEELISVDTEEDGEQIILPIFPFGTEDQRFYIRVAGSGVGSSYQLTWNASKEDDFEGENGNNIIEDASDALLDSEGVRISTTIGYAGAVNDDWYTIPVNSGDDGVVIELFYIHTVDDNLEMELFNEEGTFLRRSTGSTGVERIHFTGDDNTTYYLRVYGSNSENPYDLIWNSYSEDNLEIGVEIGTTPNNPPDNDDPDTPRGLLYPIENISTRGTQNLEFIKLEEITQLDEDWYIVQTFEDENIFIVELEFEHAQGDIDVAVYSRVGDVYTLVAQATSEDDNERIELNDLPVGDYLICVYGYGITNPKDDINWSFDPATQNYSSIEGRTEDVDDEDDDFDLSNFDLDEDIAYGLANTYSLQWISSFEDIYDIETETVGDQEVNDTRDLAAAPILVDNFGDTDEDNVIDDIERTRNVINGDGESVPFSYRRVFTYSDLAQFDDDWYRFDVDTQGIFYAALFFNSQHGSLGMLVYDANGDLVISTVDLTGSAAIRIDNFGQNTYYIQIVGNDLGVPYTLELTGAEDDAYEQNDDLSEADENANITDLADADLTNGFIQRDVDIFRVDIPDDQVHLTVRVDFGLSVEVLDADGNPLPGGFEQSGRSEESGDQLHFARGVISPEAATYYFRVTGDNFGSPYTLFWDYSAIDYYEYVDRNIDFALELDPDLIPLTNNDPSTATLTNSNLSRYRLEPLWVPSNQRNFTYQDPIQELAFDYSLLGDVELDFPYYDPFGHATQFDDDWYAIQIPSWLETSARKGNRSVPVLKRLYYTRMSAEIEFTHTDGDINMEIYESYEELIDPENPEAGTVTIFNPVPLGRAATANDIEKLSVALDPTDEDRYYYIRVYGDDAGNDYSLKWDFTDEDAYERLEDEDENNDQNSFVDRAFDLTNADGNSTEDTWLHEIEYLQDVDGDNDIDAQDGGITTRLGFGEQTDTDDWYAVVVSEGATQIQVECIAYSDNDTNYIYDPDNLDIDFEVYYLSGNDGDPNTVDLRKPILIGRSDSDTDNTQFVGTGLEKDQLTEDITTPITEGPAVFDVAEPGIYFIRIYYDNRSHPYTFKWDDLGDTDNSGDADIIQDYLFGNWSLDIADSTLPETLQVPFANSDGDRWPNWGEFALGLDWQVADYAILGQDIVEVGGVEYYQFDYLRHKDAKSMGFVFTVEESEDLVFDGTEPVFTGAEDVGEEMERVYYRSMNPASEQDKCFFRLSVEPPEVFE